MAVQSETLILRGTPPRELPFVVNSACPDWLWQLWTLPPCDGPAALIV